MPTGFVATLFVGRQENRWLSHTNDVYAIYIRLKVVFFTIWMF